MVQDADINELHDPDKVFDVELGQDEVLVAGRVRPVLL
jgi:hypothetical protein